MSQIGLETFDMSAEQASKATEEALAEITASVDELMIKDDERYVVYCNMGVSLECTQRLLHGRSVWSGAPNAGEICFAVLRRKKSIYSVEVLERNA